MNIHNENRYQLQMRNTEDNSTLLITTDYVQKGKMLGDMFHGVRRNWVGRLIDTYEDGLVIKLWEYHV